MDQIRPIGPVERDVDPVLRVERAHDERRQQDPEQRKRRPQPEPDRPQDEGPVEGDDGHLHIDIRA